MKYLRITVIFVLLLGTIFYFSSNTFGHGLGTPRSTWITHSHSVSMLFTVAWWNDHVATCYSNATKVSDATASYNCHGYAWPGDAENYGWINTPNEDNYWTDGSYRITTSNDPDMSRISYAGEDHSARPYNSLEFISKWGEGPLMIHTPAYCPWGSYSSINYYERALYAEIDGDEDIEEYTTGYWTAYHDYGIAPVSFQWYYRENGGGWQTGGTSSTYYKTVGSPGYFDVKCILTDNSSDQFEAFFGGTIYRGGGGENKLSTGKKLPTHYKLQQNYPNPFNPTTLIRYQLPEASMVTVKVFDVNGREVASLINGGQEAGYHEIEWNASKLASGTYFCRISADNYSKTIRMVLLK